MIWKIVLLVLLAGVVLARKEESENLQHLDGVPRKHHREHKHKHNEVANIGATEEQGGQKERPIFPGNDQPHLLGHQGERPIFPGETNDVPKKGPKPHKTGYKKKKKLTMKKLKKKLAKIVPDVTQRDHIASEMKHAVYKGKKTMTNSIKKIKDFMKTQDWDASAKERFIKIKRLMKRGGKKSHNHVDEGKDRKSAERLKEIAAKLKALTDH